MSISLKSTFPVIVVISTIVLAGGVVMYKIREKPIEDKGVVAGVTNTDVVVDKVVDNSPVVSDSTNISQTVTTDIVKNTIPSIKTSINTVSKPPVKTVSNSYTLADLAKHNTSSSCYIGYNGGVYNVTNSPSWSGCYHHGVYGGSDITSIFPHSPSYITSLPYVGKLTGGSTSTGSTGIPINTDDSEFGKGYDD